MWMNIHFFLVMTSPLLLQPGIAVPSNQYVDYLPGTLNVILSSPHGGDLEPGSITDRDAGCYTGGSCVWSHTCGTKDFTNCDAKTTPDMYTQNLTRELYTALYAKFGEYPPTVINLLRRSKLDANRDKPEATFGVVEAEDAWDAYHDLLAEIRQNQTGPALFLDIHGHGHPNVWVELGYMIIKSRLNSNTLKKQYSSVKSLAGDATTTEFDDMIKGSLSFGGFLQNEGYASVPSPANPAPGSNSYFSGGFNTKRYGSRYGGVIDSIQIEAPRDWRDLPGRTGFVTALANAIESFMDEYY